MPRRGTDGERAPMGGLGLEDEQVTWVKQMVASWSVGELAKGCAEGGQQGAGGEGSTASRLPAATQTGKGLAAR